MKRGSWQHLAHCTAEGPGAGLLHAASPPSQGKSAAWHSECWGRWKQAIRRAPELYKRKPLRFLIRTWDAETKFSPQVSATGRPGAHILNADSDDISGDSKATGLSPQNGPTHQLFQLNNLLFLLVYLLILHLQYLLQTLHVFFQVLIGSPCDLQGQRAPSYSPMHGTSKVSLHQGHEFC